MLEGSQEGEHVEQSEVRDYLSKDFSKNMHQIMILGGYYEIGLYSSL